jgi:hypothetical protein
MGLRHCAIACSGLEHVQHVFVVLLPAARSGIVMQGVHNIASTLHHPRQNASPS